VLPAGDLEFAVVAKNGLGTSPYGTYMDFSVVTTLPSAPTLISPSGVVTDTQPAYQWNETSQASSYRIGVYSESTASYVILTDVPGSACVYGVCSYDPPTALTQGNYRFKVLARNVLGASAYSAWMNFTVMTAAPDAPTLISPSGTISDTQPAYQWNGVMGATSYRIGVYSVATSTYVILTDLSASACTGGMCSYDPSTTLGAGNYRFKVLAKNILGASAYSGWMNFTVSP
jgi:hypothetical protein